MSRVTDQTFHLLHVVRVRGRVSATAIASAVGIDAATVESLLRDAADADHVTWHDGRAAGWSLTPAGRARHAALLGGERRAADTDAVHAAYTAFLAVNDDLKRVCTEWQLTPEGALNDHADPTYDRRVIGSLVAVDRRAQPICHGLAAARARFGTYGPRLASALERIDGGDHEWFTSPAVDSYHTVWFELHEDLLQTLGVERAEGR